VHAVRDHQRLVHDAAAVADLPDSCFLAKGAVLAHRFDRPVPAESDDEQKSSRRARRDSDPRLR
jgi:hypothetical protein